MKPITVLLADDHGGVRSGLRYLLKGVATVVVVAEAHNGLEAVNLVRELHPDVVIMDIAMPKLNGIEATRQILQSDPDTRVLMLSAHDDSAYVDKAMALGAAGYLLKPGASEILGHAIQSAAKGHTYFSPAISDRLRERDGKSKPASGARHIG